jgi:hypothetical protein
MIQDKPMWPLAGKLVSLSKNTFPAFNERQNIGTKIKEKENKILDNISI